MHRTDSERHWELSSLKAAASVIGGEEGEEEGGGGGAGRGGRRRVLHRGNKKPSGVQGRMGTLGRFVYSMAVALRETGQALDRLGARVQGSAAFKEQCKCGLWTEC